ncbi:MAG: TonB-dependent receptor [Prosthecobacter sp.]
MQKQSSSRILTSSKPGLEALSVTTLLCAAGSLAAQTTPTKPADPEKATDAPSEIPEVLVEADAAVYNVERLQSPKFTEPLRDIPQTITVIPKAIIEERGAFSLKDVLKNTPGISMQAGEGGGGLSGDNLSLRGFSTRSDFYLDGARDYGSYNRDPFNTEQVEVIKGPSSTNSGRGATGGSINLSTKMANLQNSNLETLTVGTDNLYRGTVDVNQSFNEHSAFRLNGMYHSSDTPGRDITDQERWGIAGSLAFGLGTDTRLTLNYQHLTEDNIPDYGLPWVPVNATNPALQSDGGADPKIDYSNFYGRSTVDFEDVTNDMFTVILDHDFTDKIKLRNLTRFSRTYRFNAITAPRFVSANNASNVLNQQINRQVQVRKMTNEVLSNQTNLTIEFNTWQLKHAVVAGFELATERQMNTNAALADPAAITDIFDPNPNASPAGMPQLPGYGESNVDTIAAYVFDTISINRFFEISGGLRFDHVESDSRPAGGGTGFTRQDDLLSYKAGLVYKPVEHGSIYFGYGTSFNASVDGNVGLALNANTANQPAEENKSMELGTKWDLMNERLSITAALFRTEKTNARTTDLGGNQVNAGDQTVQGVEFGIAGQLTKAWNIFAGYAFMQSEVNASGVAAELGQTLGNTPEHSANLWTTYNLFNERLQIGGGLQFVGDRFNNNGGSTRIATAYWTADATVAYKFTEKFSLRLNVYNITDERYIGSVGGGHFIPGAGRQAALTASFKF